MGRGVSAGGGQSSLGYLFGGGEAPNAPPAAKNPPAAAKNEVKASNAESSTKPAAADAVSQPGETIKQVPAGILSNNANNYMRADGQNCGNFLTERPSTKVHAAPGGGSSLGYLFGDGKN